MSKLTTRRICRIAALAALSFLLNMVQVKLPANLRITFDSLPIVVGALAFGPVDGALAGLVGEFFTQLLSEYGLTATTALWLIPPALRGIVIGLVAWGLRGTGRPLESRPALCYGVCLAASVVTTLANTAVLWLDSLLFHYYSFAMIFGSLLLRITTGLLTAIALTTAAIPIVALLRRQGLFRAL
ncbi:ECF transporter S component [uncultured Oscillibacter sp.]|uniref:ECF transporter S component n=1 Tax=uncultured Oscillibacter sp. TaxID=876091 RepID=UPI00263391B1|nr:ECF transporter S component [uncultured Oscillibacter sp.]